ncbi:MAG: fibronectin type III domain-containing protein [Bdellovibrionota bacterium]
MIASNSRIHSRFISFFFALLWATLLTGCGGSKDAPNALGKIQNPIGTCALPNGTRGQLVRDGRNLTGAPICVTDQFRQPPAPAAKKVDMLFVMDNSQSMHRHWQLIAQKIDRLVRELPANEDIRFAVIIGSIQKNTGVLFSAPSVPKVLDGTRMSSAQISEALSKTFAEALTDKNVDWIGAGEALVYSTYYASTKHAREIQAQGFFRPEAALNVFFMSDDADESFPYPSKQFWDLPAKCNYSHHEKMRKTYHLPRGINVDSTFAALKSLKGDQSVLTSAFVNITRADILVDNKLTDKCIFDSPGLGFFQIVKKSNGVLYSIHGDKGEGLARVGKMLRVRLDLIHDFTLSKPANEVDAATIEVTVDGNKVPYSYDAASNSVHVENAGQAGSLVAIHHCEPVAQETWDLTDFTGSAAQTTASLSWKTGTVATDGKVQYGVDPTALNDTVADANQAAAHQVAIANLSPNTLYYFQASSKDQNGQEKKSAVISLRTKPDWAITQLSGQASRTTASVSWNTDAYATFGRVVWGTSSSTLDNTSAETAQANSHMVMLANLSASTKYYYQAISRDEFGLEKRSAVQSFTTVADWAIVGFGGTATRSAIALSWQTPDYPTTSRLNYGLSANSLTNSVAIDGSAIPHTFTLGNLAPGTTYYLQIVATDDLGVHRTSTTISLTTIADWTLSALSLAPTETSFTASFETAGYPTSGRILWGTTAGSLLNEVKAGDGNDHLATVTGLTPDSDYYVQAVANDDLGVERRSDVTLVHTNAIPLPQWEITGLTGTATASTVTLAWSTSAYPTVGTVMYGTSPDALTSSISECGSATDHALMIANLEPDTLYYLQVVARDDRGQVQTSSPLAVRTQALPLPVWSITNFAAAAEVHTVSLTWNTSEYATKGKVKWGSSGTNLSHETAFESTAANQHSVVVTGLDPSTTYYFQAVSDDDRGQEKSSAVISVKTTFTPPTWAISGLDGTTTSNSATIIWRTDIATNGTLEIGLSADDFSFKTVAVPNFATSQLVTVPGLSASTTYYFRVTANDANGGSQMSNVIAKTTKPARRTISAEKTPAWKVSGFDGSTTPTTATLIWRTEVPTNGVLNIGLTPTDFSYRSVNVTELNLSHLVTVTNLPPATRFYFQVVAADKDALTQTSEVISKKTKSP